MAERTARIDPGRRIEVVSDANWREFCSAPVAVLMLAEHGCPACRAWTEELRGHLEGGPVWPHVRFGKIELDLAEAEGFRAANAGWLALVEGIPFNVLYVEGEPRASFAGGGVRRLASRLREYVSSGAGSPEETGHAATPTPAAPASRPATPGDEPSASRIATPESSDPGPG